MTSIGPGTGAAAAPRPAPDGEDDLYRALSRDPELPRGVAMALRDGVLRRPGGGHIAGVCAALAAAGGLPPRLVRLVALGLLALGIGLPLYLAAALLMPRERAGEAVSTPRVDIPLVSLARLDPGRGDVLMALALIPSALAAWWWLTGFALRDPAPLRLLIPVVGAGIVVLTWAALRARAIRRAYLFAALGHRAGILEDAELARTVESLRAAAPRAWAAVGPAGTEPATADGSSGAAPLGDRATAGLVGVLVAAGTVAVTVLSLVPGLASALRVASLPGGGRLAAAGGVVAVLAGVMLVVIGLRRRRSTVIALLGVLALALFATAVVWVRIDASTSGGQESQASRADRESRVDRESKLGREDPGDRETAMAQGVASAALPSLAADTVPGPRAASPAPARDERGAA